MQDYSEMARQAREYFRNGDLVSSERLFSQLLGSPEFEAEGYSGIGMIRLKSNAMVEAEGSFRRALMINSRLADSHYGIGYICEKQGKVADAIAAYENALRINPNHGGAAAQLRALEARPSTPIPSSNDEYVATGKMNLYTIFLDDPEPMSKEIVAMMNALAREGPPRRSAYTGSYILLTWSLFLLAVGFVIVFATFSRIIR